MAQLNKTCWACKTKFSYCPNCSRVDSLKPSWASEFCCETCKDLWTTLTKFGMSMITKSDAKSIILGLDLKPIDVYADCVKRDYNKVMTPDLKSKRNRRIEIKSVDELVDIKPEPIDEAVVEPMAIEPESHVVVKEENE